MVVVERGGRRATRRSGTDVGRWTADRDGGDTPPSEGPILCHCGQVLADRIDGKNVVIDGMEYQFRRKSDRLTCPACNHAHPMRSLRPVPSPEPEDSGERRRRLDRPD
jgi:hypothetical protein